jgi:ribosome maturation factor RimP
MERSMWSNNETIRRAWAQLDPVLLEHGYEIIEMEYTGGPSGAHILRIFIEKEGGGIGLDDCIAATQALNPILDEESYFGDNYCLEVSSPGIDRPVRRPQDIAKYTGETVKVATFAPVAGRKRFTGVLQGLREDLLLVECDGVPYEIHLENLKKANLDR